MTGFSTLVYIILTFNGRSLILGTIYLICMSYLCTNM